MSTKYFNFNNEADQVAIEVNDATGVVSILGSEFDSVEAFAEFYALNRDVHPDNLKNWTLVENGTRVSFVLRAGTAGNTNLVNLAASLKAAGLSPEEIGRALAAAVEEDHQPINDVEDNDIRHRALQLFIETNDYAEELLRLSLPHDLTYAIDIADLDAEAELHDEDLYDYDEEEMTFNYLHRIYNDGHRHIRAKYPNVPFKFACAVEFNHVSDLQTNSEAVEKRYVVAALASRRQLEVVTVHNTAEGNFIETTLMTQEEALSGALLYYIDDTIIRLVG